jgi:hypothetical protein
MLGTLKQRFFLNVVFHLQSVFQTLTLLMNVAISLKRCSVEKTLLKNVANPPSL